MSHVPSLGPAEGNGGRPFPTPSVGRKEAEGPSFLETLAEKIGAVDGLQKEAMAASQELATGQTTGIHETMIALEKADIAFRFLTQVRNKALEAYREIWRMQL